MNTNQSGLQLIRVGAYTAVGTLLVYAGVAAALSAYNRRKSQTTSTTTTTSCGCGSK